MKRKTTFADAFKATIGKLSAYMLFAAAVMLIAFAASYFFGIDFWGWIDDGVPVLSRVLL